jgi:hypothetical protein
MSKQNNSFVEHLVGSYVGEEQDSEIPINDGNLTRKPANYWRNEENFVREMRKAIKRFGHFPSKKELEKSGHSSLSRAVYFHGGYQKLREKFNQGKVIREIGLLKKEEYVIGKLEEISEQLGHFPSSVELREIDYGLYRGILKYHGSYQEAKKLCGFDDGRNQWGGFNDYNMVLLVIREKSDELGRFPKFSELPNGLTWSIYNKHKTTLANIRKDLDSTLQADDLEILVDGYVGGRD